MEFDENKPVDGAEKTTTEETPSNEETQTPEVDKNDYAAQILALQEEYKKKFEAQQAAFDKRLAERDKVISQLLTGNADEPAPDNDIVSRINATRNYKKW